jgi:hypothetical protein
VGTAGSQTAAFPHLRPESSSSEIRVWRRCRPVCRDIPWSNHDPRTLQSLEGRNQGRHRRSAAALRPHASRRHVSTLPAGAARTLARAARRRSFRRWSVMKPRRRRWLPGRLGPRTFSGRGGGDARHLTVSRRQRDRRPGAVDCREAPNPSPVYRRHDVLALCGACQSDGPGRTVKHGQAPPRSMTQRRRMGRSRTPRRLGDVTRARVVEPPAPGIPPRA